MRIILTNSTPHSIPLPLATMLDIAHLFLGMLIISYVALSEIPVKSKYHFYLHAHARALVCPLPLRMAVAGEWNSYP